MDYSKKPTAAQIEDALTYFVDAGFIHQMNSDAMHYTKILAQYAALSALNQRIEWLPEWGSQKNTWTCL